MPTPYIGSTLPSKIIMTDGVTTLFRIAARELGDPLQWWRIAQLNILEDPWVGANVQLKIPARSNDVNGGVPHG